jgi:subtilisin family serine protease
VIDDGIDKTHPDIPNIYPLSFDAITKGTSTIYLTHGTKCAGIIGAKANNKIGITGIAPDCPLMAISHDLYSSPNIHQELADGINFAWQNDASVITNSWGHSYQLNSGLIDNAISDALKYGRNRKGCVVIFSAGNNNTNVHYPANSNPDIIAVGAIDTNGQRAYFSNYGNELDIVAPGANIATTTTLMPGYHIYDIFSGTSAAAPHIAGIAALMLSVNPGLTHKQVANIIEKTAKKIYSAMHNI